MRIVIFSVLSLLLQSVFTSSIKVRNIQEIEVGRRPKGIYVHDNKVYVALSGEEAIAVLDFDQSTNTYANLTKWPISGTPFDVVSSIEGDRILVSQNSLSSLSTLSSLNGVIIDSSSVPKGPTFLSRENRENVAYFTSSDSNIFESFNMESFSMIRSYRTGLKPVSSDVNRLGRIGYICNNGDNTVSVINLLNGLDVSIALSPGSAPTSCKLSRGDEYLLVTLYSYGSLLLINTTSLSIQRSLAVGYRPSYVDTDEQGLTAFVSNYEDGTISVVDLVEQVVVDTITVGSNPSVVRVFSNKIYVTNESGGSITIIDFE